MLLPYPRTAFLAVAILMLAGTNPLFAALGAPAADIQREGQVVAAPGHQLTQVPQGIQQQTVLTSQNVTVTEYSSAGVVFAVRWEGPVIPDQQSLLGTYFPEYAGAMQTHTSMGRNAPVQLHTPKLVVHMQGHMRAYTGTAYAPALVPNGLSLSSLGIDP